MNILEFVGEIAAVSMNLASPVFVGLSLYKWLSDQKQTAIYMLITAVYLHGV